VDALIIWCGLSLFVGKVFGDTLKTQQGLFTPFFGVPIMVYDMDLRVINFPDKVFKKYLIENFDRDNDGEISLTEAQSITKILCPNMGIKSIAGIEYFSNLKVLDCSRNDIELINISENKLLEHLSCYGNHELWALDVSKNTSLISLYCGNCNIGSMDVNNNKELTILSCRFNPIEEINLCYNTKLTMLRVRRCELEQIDLSHLKELSFLDCSENNLYKLELFGSPKLNYLDCRCNKSLRNVYVNQGHYIEKWLSPVKPISPQQEVFNNWKEYQDEKMNDADNLSDPYGDEQVYYDGWSREDVESGLADAYDGDLDARWNND
jgi:hypothetical protein